MIAQVLQRMNRREQVLAGLVALVVFFLANLFLWSGFCAPLEIRESKSRNENKHTMSKRFCCGKAIYGRNASNGCASISRFFTGPAMPRPCSISSNRSPANITY